MAHALISYEFSYRRASETLELLTMSPFATLLNDDELVEVARRALQQRALAS